MCGFLVSGSHNRYSVVIIPFFWRHTVLKRAHTLIHTTMDYCHRSCSIYPYHRCAQPRVINAPFSAGLSNAAVALPPPPLPPFGGLKNIIAPFTASHFLPPPAPPPWPRRATIASWGTGDSWGQPWQYPRQHQNCYRRTNTS